MPNARLAHVMVFAKNIDALVRFYANAFDLKPEPTSDARYLVLKSDSGAGIAIHALPAHIADCIQLKNPPDWREQTTHSKSVLKFLISKRMGKSSGYMAAR